MRVLIGYDGSKLADAALADLQKAGLPDDIEAVVLSVADVVAPPALPPDVVAGEPKLARELQGWRERVEAALIEARALAGGAAARLQNDFPHWKISADAVADSPAWALVRRAEGSDGKGWHADLIVFGTAGRSGTDHFIFGSVAHQVLTHSRCSTRIGRTPEQQRTPGPLRLLIGIDGSSGADAAVRAVAARKWPAGTECRIVTVLDSHLTSALPLKMLPLLLTPDSAAQSVANLGAQALRSAGLVVSPTIKHGGAARFLIQEAEEFGADCIFVGARGLRRAERFVLGSVSTSVAMRANCSVEVVHADGLAGKPGR